MRMLVAGLSEHLSMTLLDEGRGWHFDSWHRRKNAVTPAEPCALARARLFPTIEAALGYFRQFSPAAPGGGPQLAPAARAFVAGQPSPAPAPAPPVPAESAHHGVTTDPRGVFEWIPTASVAQALASSWNLGLAIAAIEGHRAGLQMRLMNGGVVYLLGDAAVPATALNGKRSAPAGSSAGASALP